MTVASDVNRGLEGFSLSRSGTLIYVPGQIGGGGSLYQMVWVDRSGTVTVVDPAWKPVRLTASGNSHGWALSPDGRQLAIGLTTDAGNDIWIKQIPSGALTKLTSGRAWSFRPRWMPGGRSVYYPGNGGVSAQRADGVGPVTRLWVGGVGGAANPVEAVVSPDSQWLIVRVGSYLAVTSMVVGSRARTRPWFRS